MALCPHFTYFSRFCRDTSAQVAKIGDVTLTEDQMRADLGPALSSRKSSFHGKRSGGPKGQDILFNQAAKQAGLSRKDWEAREIGSARGSSRFYRCSANGWTFCSPGCSFDRSLKMATITSPIKQDGRLSALSGVSL